MRNSIEHYSTEELAEIHCGIDRKAHPEKFQRVSELLDERLSKPEVRKPNPTVAFLVDPHVYVEKKYVCLVRISWLALSAVLIYIIFDRLDQETLNRSIRVFHKGEFNHFIRAIEPLPLAIVLLRLGILGTREKKE